MSEQSMEFHDAANIFPMRPETIGELSEDIKKNGQIIPIEIFEGKILDGRRRFAACNRAGIIPDTIDVNPDDPVAYVISLNLHRRSLTQSEKGLIQAKGMAVYKQRAKERQGERSDLTLASGDATLLKASHEAGKAIGVSGATVERASVVLKHGVPELVKAVEDGKISVTAAAKIARSEAPEKQVELAEKAENPRRPPQACEESKMHSCKNGKVYDGPRYIRMAIAQLECIEDDDPRFDESFNHVINYSNKRMESKNDNTD